VTLRELFRQEALREVQAQVDVLRDTLDLAGALALPAATCRDIVLCGREAQLTIFRQADQPSAGAVLVTAQVARHGLGGVTSLRYEQGLVFSPGCPARDATDDELRASGSHVPG
jgi:hypothetical protein